ncbi:uncharacterized protein B0H64DRAFT_388309 [Chaetomium fimeti]|uniref:Uncharacterized protein n=1 Tax=Chaetomium fimeti TaxID=1854472 RepID=A0AAE0HMN7_9PEZI|nr:hypothetical protein B0H64DRAFT_388309 [Chaetomium fimeti]
MQHQQQQQQQPQQHQQQQQQQQPLMWKPNASGGQNPQFPSVKHNNNPNQPTIPPPEVLQAIKQQEQRLPQGQGQVAQGGAGANGAGKTSGTAPALAASSAGYDGSGWGDDDGEFK